MVNSLEARLKQSSCMTLVSLDKHFSSHFISSPCAFYRFSVTGRKRSENSIIRHVSYVCHVMSCQMKNPSLLHSFVDCCLLSEVYIHCTQHFESGCILG